MMFQETKDPEVIKNRLNLFATLGHLHKEKCKKNGIDLDAIFNKCMDDTNDIEDPVERIHTAMANYQLEMLKTMPLENRCIFVLNGYERGKKDQTIYSDEDIDWKKVNEILFDNPLQYDYNICKSVNSIDAVTNLLMAIRQSYIIGGPWYKQKCKTCGETFYLAFDEISFYQKKELHIPKRCKNCIDESKGKESIRQKVKKEKENRERFRKQLAEYDAAIRKANPDAGKTAMEKAFEKAKREKESFKR